MTTLIAEMVPWPSGDYWSVGALEWTPTTLPSPFALRFEPELDDLGELTRATMVVDGIGQACFVWRPDKPEFGLEICVDMATPRDRVFRWLMAQGVQRKNLLWTVGHPRDPRNVRAWIQLNPGQLAAAETALDVVPADVRRRLRIVA